MSLTAPPAVGRLAAMAPALTAAVSFSVADILLKAIYASGMDVLTLVSLRGVLVVAVFWCWLKLSPPARWHSPRQTKVAIGLGVLFACTIFGLLKAISLLPVSIAILAYFIYPLLTGIAGAVTGVERLGWRALLTAVAAFLGLALMLGQQIGDLSLVGLAFAFGAAVFRVASLLGTRAWLSGTDARVTTWYSMVPSTILFLGAAALSGEWNMPAYAWGWAAFLGAAITTTASTLLIYMSTNSVGPFRTALIMNLEPLLTLIFSMILLGEVLTIVQLLGAAAMIGSLCAFQSVRGR
jgi:drug/metabolite transporter (DMT)-like permease